MDTINEFLKNQLPKDFGIGDNKAIEYLSECMQELKENGLNISSKQIIPVDELPSQPFGHVDKITRERIINNQKKQSMDQIVEKFKSTVQNSTLSSKSDEDSSDEYGKDENEELNPTLSEYDYDKESAYRLTDSSHSSLNNEETFHKNSSDNCEDQRLDGGAFYSIISDKNKTIKNEYTSIRDHESKKDSNIKESPMKNTTTKIVYHTKEDVEYIKNSHHGIYTKSAFKSTPKKGNKTDYI